jgi:hypothetical protein
VSDLEELLRLGGELDARFHEIGGEPLERAEWGGLEPSVRDLLIERMLRIRNKRGRLVKLRPNRAQREYGRRCTRRNIVLKARQLGITTYVAARFFIQTITRPGTLSVQVAHDQRSAEEIFRIVHRFHVNLPAAQKAVLTSRANVRQLIFPRLDSEYRVETAADPNAGRGLTIHNLHCSEVARWPRDALEALASLRAAVPPSGEVVLESTPNGAGGRFYEEWELAEENGYTRHFFPWWWEPSYKEDARKVGQLTEEEQVLVERERLSREQIAFRRKIRSSLRGLAGQEFVEDATTCFLASGECVFDSEVVQAQLAKCGPALQRIDSGRLLIWFPPQPKREYIIGVDPAGGGTEGDYACAQVMERETGMQCAELHGHYGPQALAFKVAELGKMYNMALVAVERNNHGFGVLAYLATGEGYPRVYEHGGQAGWLTNAATRPAMVENLAAVVGTAPELFHSPRFLEECRTFVRHGDGWTGAVGGAHDDCVMAMAIAFAVRKQAAGALSKNAMKAMVSM